MKEFFCRQRSEELLQEQAARRELLRELHRKHGHGWKQRAAPEDLARFLHPQTPILQTQALTLVSREDLEFLALRPELKVYQAMRDAGELPEAVAFFLIARGILGEILKMEKERSAVLKPVDIDHEDFLEGCDSVHAKITFRTYGEPAAGELLTTAPAEFERFFLRGKEAYEVHPFFGRKDANDAVRSPH
jgi:hypothetical protein